MKAKLKPTRHGKWSHKKDSINKKMILVRELFNLVGAELNHGPTIPKVIFCKFYGNERRFTFDKDSNDNIFINEKFIKSKDLDYIITCAICFFYTEKRPDLIMGGKVTLVDIHSCIDISDNVIKDIFKIAAKNVAAIALTHILVKVLI